MQILHYEIKRAYASWHTLGTNYSWEAMYPSSEWFLRYFLLENSIQILCPSLRHLPARLFFKRFLRNSSWSLQSKGHSPSGPLAQLQTACLLVLFPWYSGPSTVLRNMKGCWREPVLVKGTNETAVVGREPSWRPVQSTGDRSAACREADSGALGVCSEPPHTMGSCQELYPPRAEELNFYTISYLNF